MFDVTNAKSFHHTTGSYNGGVEVWLSNLKCSSYMHEGMVKFLIGLHRNNGRRQVTYEEAQSFARDNELTYVEVDPTDHCHTNYIIKLCVEKIIERIDSGFYGDPPRFDRYGIKILGSKELADTGPIQGKEVTPFGYDSPDEEEVKEEMKKREEEEKKRKEEEEKNKREEEEKKKQEEEEEEIIVPKPRSKLYRLAKALGALFMLFATWCRSKIYSLFACIKRITGRIFEIIKTFMNFLREVFIKLKNLFMWYFNFRPSDDEEMQPQRSNFR